MFKRWIEDQCIICNLIPISKMQKYLNIQMDFRMEVECDSYCNVRTCSGVCTFSIIGSFVSGVICMRPGFGSGPNTCWLLGTYTSFKIFNTVSGWRQQCHNWRKRQFAFVINRKGTMLNQTRAWPAGPLWSVLKRLKQQNENSLDTGVFI